MNELIPNIDLVDFDGELRMRDTDLAEWLEFEQPRDIRKLINRNLAEIEMLGPTRRRGAMVGTGSGAQREVEEYWLNEGQAIAIVGLSRAPKARACCRSLSQRSQRNE